MMARLPATIALAAASCACAAAAAPAAPAGLYALYETADPNDVGVILTRQWPNGTRAAVGGLDEGELVAQQLAALDPVSGTLYLLGLNDTMPNLMGLSLATGAVVSNCALPFPGDGFVGDGQFAAWDSKRGALLVGGQLSAAAIAPFVFGRLDTASCAFDKLYELPATAWQQPLGGVAEYVPPTDAFVVQMLNRSDGTTFEVAIDAGTPFPGSAALHREDVDSGRNLQSLAFDLRSGLLLGVSVRLNAAGDGYERTLASVEPATWTWRTVGAIASPQGFFDESGGVSAVDPASGTLYWVAQGGGAAAPRGPLYLVGVNTSDARIVSVGELGPQDTSTPWALEFYSTRRRPGVELPAGGARAAA